MEYKYLIAFTVPEPKNLELRRFIEMIAIGASIPAPKLSPYVTFHKPLVGISEEKIVNLVRSAVLNIRSTRLVLGSPFAFGKKYIVLPVHATLILTKCWVRLDDLFSALRGYQHGEFDGDNTLHLTIAETNASSFDIAWGIATNKNAYHPMEISVTKLDLYRKPLEGGIWELVEEFDLPKN